MSKVTTNHKEKLFVIFGGLFLVALVISAWVPQPCPVLRSTFFGCPSTVEPTSSLTGAAAELARVPSQIITPNNAADFKVPSQDYRVTTEVSFEFWADTTEDYAYLQVMENGNYKNIALVSYPLLTKLTWARVQDIDPTMSLYQENPVYNDVSDVLKNMPPQDTIAVDESAAETLNLSPDQYTPLENLTNLNGISTIITTYIPRQPDGSWSKFDQVFDLTNADISSNVLLFRVLTQEEAPAAIPFRMSSVHVNYQQMHS